MARIIPEKALFVERIIDTEDDDPAGTNNQNPYLFTGRRVDILDGGSLKLQYNRNRYYDTYTGRWLTKDPLGIDPAVMAGKIYSAYQHKDGMNLYEYVKSSPIIKLDAFGFASEKVCCKLKYSSLTYLDIGEYGYEDQCTQKTVGNSRGLSANEACKCKYGGKKTGWRSLFSRDYTVTGSADGKCEWCTVKLKVRKVQYKYDTELPIPHFFVEVYCKDFTYNTQHNSEQVVTVEGEDSVKTLWKLIPLRKFKTSKKAAMDFYGKYHGKNVPWDYRSCGDGLCLAYAEDAMEKIKMPCP